MNDVSLDGQHSEGVCVANTTQYVRRIARDTRWKWEFLTFCRNVRFKFPPEVANLHKTKIFCRKVFESRFSHFRIALILAIRNRFGNAIVHQNGELKLYPTVPKYMRFGQGHGNRSVLFSKNHFSNFTIAIPWAIRNRYRHAIVHKNGELNLHPSVPKCRLVMPCRQQTKYVKFCSLKLHSQFSAHRAMGSSVCQLSKQEAMSYVAVA